MIVDKAHVKGVGRCALCESIDEEIAIECHGIGRPIDAINSGDHEIQAIFIRVNR